MLGVFWAIQHAILRGGHSGVGGKPDLALLEMSAGGKQRLFKEAEQADIDQLEQEIADLEEKIGAFQDAPVPKDAEVPAPPETTASKPSG